MDKARFIALLQGEDPVLAARLHSQIEAAFAGRPVISAEFYTPAVWMALEALPGVLPEGSGFYDLLGCDRRLFASPLEAADQGIALLEVRNLYPARPLAHKDYLGALMNLGIRREKFADLFLSDVSCFIPMVPEILPFVLENLTKVAQNGVMCRKADLRELEQTGRSFLEIQILTASLRLDALVSELTGLSRSKAEDLIRSGKVLLNYRESKDRSHPVKMGDILTIRGYGKFRLREIQGESKKGKLRVAAEQYR